jgi:hypothetical protein
MAAFDFDQTAESVSARPARRGLEYCRVERALHSCFKQKQFGWNTRTGFREEICDENLPECDLSHNCIDKINEKIVGSEEYLNSELGNRLLERKKEGLCLRVQHATPFRPRQFPTGALQVPRQCRPMVPGTPRSQANGRLASDGKHPFTPPLSRRSPQWSTAGHNPAG